MKNRARLTRDELETVWLRLNGQLKDQGDVPNLFAEGMPCGLLYGRVYDARERLSARAGIGFEDRDLLEIIESLEEIGKLCGFGLYDYAMDRG